MDTKKLVIGGTIIVIAGALVFVGISAMKGTAPKQDTTPVTQQSENDTKNALPTNATTPVPISPSETKTENAEGTVTAVSAESITVNGQSFSIANTKDVQKVGGSVQGGNTMKAEISDVAVGQKVLLAIDANTKAVISIFILP